MTQEDKELLLKDLCARLPYGLKVKCEKYPFPVTVLYAGNINEVKFKQTAGGPECVVALVAGDSGINEKALHYDCEGHCMSANTAHKDLFFADEESEDERIRKELIEELKSKLPFCSEEFTKHRIIRQIAYLEKQKEQKEASKAIEAVERIDKYIDENLVNAHDMEDSNPGKKYYLGWDDALSKLSGILQDVYSNEKQKEQKPHLTVNGKGVYKLCPHCKTPMIRYDSKVYTSMPPKYGYNCPKCGATEFDTVMYDDPEIEEQKPISFNESYNPDDYEVFREGNATGLRRKEQNPESGNSEKPNNHAEWSEEDEEILGNIINHYALIEEPADSNGIPKEKYITLLKSLSPRPKQEWSEEDERMLDLFNSLITRSEVSEIITPSESTELRAWLKSLRPQSRQVWSEEDEDKVDDICKLIEHATIIPRSGDDDTGIPPTRLNDKYKGELKAFVKYLRNRPTKSDTWKPCEEQMRHLKRCFSHGKPHLPMPNQYILEALYNDLKKLM